jgi:bacillolysin
MTMLRKTSQFVISAVLVAMIGTIANAAPKSQARNPAAIARLESEVGTEVSLDAATGSAKFVKIKQGSSANATAITAQSKKELTASFVNRNAGAFGLRAGSAELKLRKMDADSLGQTHLTYTQVYAGLPVFGAVLKAHFDASGKLSVVNGTLVPDIDVSAAPSRSIDEVEAAAVKFVKGNDLSARGNRLLIFREGLAKGVPGDNHLAYEVEVGNGANVREFVYVDAHTGKVIDQITGTPDGLNRRAYDGQSLPTVPPSYPGTPYWVEGDAFPTASTEANNMIQASKETYDLFSNAFGRDSFDGAGATMDAIFNRGYSCPNASWNGTFISFCPGITTDDVTGHEWTHAYTEYTDGLIYAWQPGALNESYSDIFGETVDRINGRGGDTPDNLRTQNACSVYWGTPPPTLTITGGSAAGSYFSRASVSEPPRPFTVGPTPMAVVATATPFQPTGACGAVTGVSGKIAIIDWTLTPSGANECGSGARATNARLAGATGIIFVAPASGILNLGASNLIASVEVTNADGATIKAGLPADATITLGVGTDNSKRWLLGEDSTAPGSVGALRDMSSPRCFGNPGKVSDTFEYTCSTADQGGVHTNSGVPNHAYSLIVDGGTYNGQTISGIGLTKAAHIYFRAKIAYQGPATDFADHADALEQSCSDLTGVNLASLTTGTPSGEVITASDCAQVAKALLAVEMRTPPTQCGFQPLLAQNPPAVCPPGKSPQKLFFDNFENGTASIDRFTETHAGTADFTPRDWAVVSELPDGRPGRAFFAPDPTYGTCAPGGDETAVLHLDTPVITLPATAPEPRVAFDHWVATEAGWDGGNVKISVNGGAWQLIPASAFVYNAYNATLFTAAQGNTNPIAGELAFTGTDGGAVDGSWGRSIIDLTGIAKPKDKIVLRFDLGTDGCGGVFGWYVDDLQVLQCR